jgi:hypothetical protein
MVTRPSRAGKAFGVADAFPRQEPRKSDLATSNSDRQNSNFDLTLNIERAAARGKDFARARVQLQVASFRESGK